MAERFVDAWAQQDFHGDARRAQRLRQVRSTRSTSSPRAYLDAQDAATATAIDPGDADGPKTVDGKNVVEVDVGSAPSSSAGRRQHRAAARRREDRLGSRPHLPGPAAGRARRPPADPAVAGRDPRQGRNAAGRPGPTDDRTSPLGTDAIDVAGETGMPDTELRPKVQKEGFPGDQDTGVSGLELAFNPRLAGQPGGQLLAVKEEHAPSRRPQTARPAASSPPPTQTPASRCTTTIDPDLQEPTVSALGGRSGGVAVLDARTGAVRALAGLRLLRPRSPRARPSRSSPRPRALEKRRGEARRVLQSGLLDQPRPGQRRPRDRQQQRRGLRRHLRAGVRGVVQHGLRPARSQGGRRAAGRHRRELRLQPGAEPLQPAGDRAVDPGKPSIPTRPRDRDRRDREAIGQGQVLATPLGMASVAQTVAAGGKRQPDADRHRPEPAARREDGRRHLAGERARADRPDERRGHRGHRRPRRPRRTSRSRARPAPPSSARSRISRRPSRSPPGETPPEPKQIVDAWFIAFAPAQKPKIAIAVMLIDASGDGGETAAPIAHDIMASVFG